MRKLLTKKQTNWTPDEESKSFDFRSVQTDRYSSDFCWDRLWTPALTLISTYDPSLDLKHLYYQVHVVKFGVFCKYYRRKCLSVCWGCRMSLHDCRRALLTGLQRCGEEEQQGIKNTSKTDDHDLSASSQPKAITLQRWQGDTIISAWPFSHVDQNDLRKKYRGCHEGLGFLLLPVCAIPVQ